MRSTLLSISLLLAAGNAAAESLPAAGRYDGRMKQVAYNRSDVVKVIGHYGYSTDIEFATGEAVQNIAIGDSLAWEVAPAGNHLFVKPREEDAVTNMTVVTNKRVYQFALDARHGAGSKDRSMYFQVRFGFPDEDAAREKAELDARIAKSNAIRMESALKVSNLPTNWNYYACGARSVRPSEIYDDGRFTFMRFPGAQEIPAFFTVNADGTESIVNGAMSGDQYVVQITARRFVLRHGKSVGCIENRSYDPYGVSTPTSTTSPDVKRMLAKPPAASTKPSPPGDAANMTTGPGAMSQPVDKATPLQVQPFAPTQGVSHGY
jgi:type IV secretion system protein VirB9